MKSSPRPTGCLLALTLLLFSVGSAQAADPGTPVADWSSTSDQKAGSILIYNLYSSNPTRIGVEDTRLSLTNTSATSRAWVHLFLIDSASCVPADTFVCLTPNQTVSFLASDLDPGVSGFIIAVAVDAAGVPLKFNFLVGEAQVKLTSGHAANLPAEALSAIAGIDPGPGGDLSPDGTLVAVRLDGLAYNQAPRVLAVSTIPSAADSNATLIVINRIDGDLTVGAAPVGDIFGLLFDDVGRSFSFTFSGRCQVRLLLSDNTLRTTPRFSRVIPGGRTGWMKFWIAGDGGGIMGVVLNANSRATLMPSSFAGGHNLHKLTLHTEILFIPVFPPPC